MRLYFKEHSSVSIAFTVLLHLCLDGSNRDKENQNIFKLCTEEITFFFGLMIGKQNCGEKNRQNSGNNNGFSKARADKY